MLFENLEGGLFMIVQVPELSHSGYICVMDFEFTSVGSLTADTNKPML